MPVTGGKVSGGYTSGLGLTRHRDGLPESIFENGAADGRKPFGPGRPRDTGGLAPYRRGNLENALSRSDTSVTQRITVIGWPRQIGSWDQKVLGDHGDRARASVSFGEVATRQKPVGWRHAAVPFPGVPLTVLPLQRCEEPSSAQVVPASYQPLGP